jgi:hypothetical protein
MRDTHRRISPSTARRMDLQPWILDIQGSSVSVSVSVPSYYFALFLFSFSHLFFSFDCPYVSVCFHRHKLMCFSCPKLSSKSQLLEQYDVPCDQLQGQFFVLGPQTLQGELASFAVDKTTKKLLKKLLKKVFFKGSYNENKILNFGTELKRIQAAPLLRTCICLPTL